MIKVQVCFILNETLQGASYRKYETKKFFSNLKKHNIILCILVDLWGKLTRNWWPYTNKERNCLSITIQLNWVRNWENFEHGWARVRGQNLDRWDPLSFFCFWRLGNEGWIQIEHSARQKLKLGNKILRTVI